MIFIKLKIFFIITILFFIVFYSTTVYSAAPKLINKLNSAFEDIEEWLIKLATPAAAVAVGTGIFMKKFSFGDEERIRNGKKLIRTSIVSYAFILALDLIISLIQNLIG